MFPFGRVHVSKEDGRLQVVAWVFKQSDIVSIQEDASVVARLVKDVLRNEEHANVKVMAALRKQIADAVAACSRSH